MFCEKGLLRNFAKLTGKHLCQSLFFNKVYCDSGIDVFLWFCEIFKNNFFYRTPPSENWNSRIHSEITLHRCSTWNLLWKFKGKHLLCSSLLVKLQAQGRLTQNPGKHLRWSFCLVSSEYASANSLQLYQNLF